MNAVHHYCVVCGTFGGPPVYRQDAAVSISSKGTPFGASTVVYACTTCAHVQTAVLHDIDAYYDSDYQVHMESGDADDLYDVRDGVRVYRATHQANVAADKLALPQGASVLDYGCGKGMTLRALLARRPDLDGAVFDVSDAYRGSWDAFVPRERQATFVPPASWTARFDAVLSCFALEHVADPLAFLRAIHALLRPGGTLHLIVPNVRKNVGDFIVVDHVNHFMPTSLRRAFAAAGFDRIRIDENAHDAAYVVDARRAESSRDEAGDPDEIAGYVDEARACAAFWSQAGACVAAFERDVARGRRSAIYGSGLYGTFVASRLANPSALAYFLDRNPHQQAKRLVDRAIVAPDAIGDDIEVVYAALNPARARDIIASVRALHRRARDFFFLPHVGEALATTT